MKKAIPTAIIFTVLLSTLTSLVSQAQTTLIAKESTWTYLDNGSDQGTAWRDSGFVTTSWSTGQAPLGMGGITGATMNTTINRNITTYFIKEVNITNPHSYPSLS